MKDLCAAVALAAAILSGCADSSRACTTSARIAGSDLDAAGRRSVQCFAHDLQVGDQARLTAQEPAQFAGNAVPTEVLRSARAGTFQITLHPIGDAFSWRPLTIRFADGRHWSAVLVGGSGGAPDSWGVGWGDATGPLMPTTGPG